MSVYFQDVAQEFVPHYFELLAKGDRSVKPMYAEAAELVLNEESVKGRDAVVDAVAKLKLQAPGNDAFLAQPGKEADDIFVTVHTGGYLVTFMLANVGENNRFAIKSQIVHKSQK